jgi:hypothetical protein
MNELLQDRHVKVLGRPSDKALQVCLTNGSNGVDISRAAVVLCEVCNMSGDVSASLVEVLTSSEALINVARSKNK